MAELDETEQEAMDSLLHYMKVVKSWGDNVNQDEMVGAIHILEQFVIQRMLHRLNPEYWSNWYEREKYAD